MTDTPPPPRNSRATTPAPRSHEDLLFWRVLLASLAAHIALLMLAHTFPAPSPSQELASTTRQAQRLLAIMPGKVPREPVTTAPTSQSPAAAPTPTAAPLPPTSSTAPDALSDKPARPSRKAPEPRQPPSEPESPRQDDNAPQRSSATPQLQRAATRKPPSTRLIEAAPQPSSSAPSPHAAPSTDAPGNAPARAEDAHAEGSAASSQATIPGPPDSAGAGLPASKNDTDALRAAYLQRLVPDIAGRHFYPRNARRLGLEGRVLVALTIDAHGDIVALDIYRSSGHLALDDAALTALRRLPRLPPPPPALLTRDRLRVIVPMNYRLSGAP
ncbi:TonB family protein [Lujinxingia vulgaris]|uniref:TonB family protein n=1 Tax=Lujinxingia vulgaris TaxID=2600176 RepID=A0A5C6XAQ7_9DELT|nr:energy transducer TonB [Lujinxingia vulgaris]TXD36766.1 TonB family protein [Lujinxingia vulgaris]